MLKASKIIVVFLCVFVGQNLGFCQIEKSYWLSGEIKGIDAGWIYVKHRQTKKIDSAKIEHGKFLLSGKTQSPEFCNIGMGNLGKREFYFGFFLQAGKIKMAAHKDSLYDAAVKFEGSPVQVEFKRFQQKMRYIDSLGYKIYLATEHFNKKDSLDSEAKKLEKQRKQQIWEYAQQYPNSYVTVFEASSYLTEKEDLSKLAIIYSRLNPKLRQWFYAKKIEAILNKK